MEAAVERRSAKGPRIPLDVLVELRHEDFDEPFEADGVNIGVGGLSMRAPYLPDVGVRMTCRFASPGSGEELEADAEVVWAQDTGSHTGEFGLRFVDLDVEAEQAIRRMVSDGGSYRPPPPDESDGQAAEAPPSTVDLGLDGVSTPIVARVLHADDDGMAVEQELPFLRLRTGVTAPDGRRGRIETVDLAVDGDTPKLLLDISWDERSFVVPEADATIPDFIATGDEAPDTLADAEPDEANGARVIDARSSAPPAPDPADTWEADADEEHEPSAEEVYTPPASEEMQAAAAAMEAATEGPQVRQPSQVFRTPTEEELAQEAAQEQARRAQQAEQAASVASAASQNGSAIERIRAKVAPLADRAGPAAEKARERLAELWTKVGPLWVAAVAFCKKHGKRVATHVGPASRSFLAALRRFATRVGFMLRDKLGQRFPRLAPRGARRRTTSAPRKESNVAVHKRKQRRDAEPEAKPGKGRTIAVSIIAAAAVGLAVYAFTAEGEEVAEEGRIDVHREVAAPAAAAASSDAVDPEAGDTQASEAPAEAGDTTVHADVQPSVPSAVGDPSRQAGPMPRPTFPSLREGARPPAPQGLPEGSPYAVDAREGGEPAEGAAGGESAATPDVTVFGADTVPSGRSFLIRMSRPVESIEGTALTDGFRVRIPGSLSLDRAGPVAAAHPLIDRSMILNRGDHAELTIRFVEGETPAYRVVARGSAIEVVVQQR